jgi:5-methylcytosine-specific restriction endonuclease McrA
MIGYFSESNIASRLAWLVMWGNSTSLTSKSKPEKDDQFVIEVTGTQSVSKPCWEELIASCDSYDTQTIFLKDVDFQGSQFLFDAPDSVKIYQFFYSNFEEAKSMALRVSSSARDKRKNRVRRDRLQEAGGFHTARVIEELFIIQEGKCYYSGDELLTHPKNYAVDHLCPVYLGGTDWPENLALVITEVNLKKGALASDDEILDHLARSRDKKWLNSQLDFMDEVDEKRKVLDSTFKSENE